jgi:hypothetical protein
MKSCVMRDAPSNVVEYSLVFRTLHALAALRYVCQRHLEAMNVKADLSY